MLKLKLLLLISVLFFINIGYSQETTKANISSNFTDSHLHYLDFLQQTDGTQKLIAAMDKAGIQNAMINGIPLIKKWGKNESIQPVYYLDNDSKAYYYSLTDEILAKDIKALPQDQQKRFHPFICGFNPTDKNAVNHIKQMVKWYPNFWQGIGEIITRHGVLTDLTEGETATADSPSLDPVYDYAAKEHMPVLIHSDISTIWVSQDSNSAKSPLYLHEITNALVKHPNTIFIWAHAGLDRDIKVDGLVSIIDKQLKKYNNLYIDISGFSYPYLIHNNVVDPMWLALIKKYPDRFMLGTDEVGHFQDYSQKLTGYKNIVKSLPNDVAIKIASTNFLNLLPKYK